MIGARHFVQERTFCELLYKVPGTVWGMFCAIVPIKDFLNISLKSPDK